MSEASKSIDFEKEADSLTGEILFANPMHRKALLSRWARSLLARAWEDGVDMGLQVDRGSAYVIVNPYKEPESK